MLANTQVLLIWLVLTASAFWLIPPTLPALRVWLVASSSAVLIYAFAPWAFIFVVWMLVVSFLAARLIVSSRRRLYLWGSIILVCLPLVSLRSVLDGHGLWFTLGVTFATLRAVSVIFDSYSLKTAPTFRQNALHLLFLPLYTVGPIQRVQSFGDDAFATSPDLKFMARGLSRICLGLFKTIAIAEQLIRGNVTERFGDGLIDFSAVSPAQTLVFVGASFAYTWINFSGFVDIANGASRLFGLRVMENFNLPILARNLQDFWKRWHMSLGEWINRYLYFPLVASIRTAWAPYAAIFIAFVAIGWWHETSWNYIAWGFLHGAGLCLVLYWQRTMKTKAKPQYEILVNNRVYVGLSWALTLFYVAWVQTFANLSTFDQGIDMTLRLIGTKL